MNLIAHKYGNRGKSFDKTVFWNDIRADMDDLESGCRQVLETLRTEDIVFSGNLRPVGFGRRKSMIRGHRRSALFRILSPSGFTRAVASTTSETY